MKKDKKNNSFPFASKDNITEGGSGGHFPPRTKPKRRPPQKYIEYDYEKAYQHSLDAMAEYFTEVMLKQTRRAVYATKTIAAGAQFEVELYPEFSKRADVPPQWLKKDNREAQRVLNNRNSCKMCERTINENFTTDDIWITLTYLDHLLPEDIDEAQRNVKNYIARINYRRRKLGLPPAKYVYVTEWEEDGDGAIRCHHHVVFDGLLDMDTVETTWRHGKRNEVRHLDYDENGLSGLSNYITKKPRGVKKWCASLGLKKPQSRKNHYKFKQKDINDMVKDFEQIREKMERAYPNYWFTYAERKYNDYNKGFYIYVRMRRKAAAGDYVQIASFTADQNLFDTLARRGTYKVLEVEESEARALVQDEAGRAYRVPIKAIINTGKPNKKRQEDINK